MHPLLDPFTGSREAAVQACLAYAAARHPVGTRIARHWPRGIGQRLCVLFAWFETARELGRVESEFVRQRGLELLRNTLDDALIGAPRANGALGLALPPVLTESGSSPMALISSLEERERGLAIGALASRTELLAHAAKLTHPEAHAYLGILGEAGERERLQAQALAEGLQLVRWLVNARSELRAGRLRFAADDVARFQVSLYDLARSESTPAISALSASQSEWAGGLLVKGWGLCQGLGYARGRVLAGLLRWNMASLAALEERGFDLEKQPPGGRIRLLACLTTAIATRVPAAW